jgi:ribosome-associated heat shock protein Hsp15
MRGRDAESREVIAEGGLRIDKWLWFTRFFKTRSEATTAVTGGLVHVDDERVKPSRPVRSGERLTITKGDLRFEVIVQGMPVRRGPAIEARTHFLETPESVAARERKQEQLKLAPPAPTGRPGKHDRRALRALRGR